MAKSVLELAVGTGQWDAGLKKAKSALDNFTQANGGLQQALDKESQKMQKFVQMMGGMESTAKTAKGQMNDYKGTIEQLTMQYNRMTEAQKKVIGQDYLQAIEQMKQRYQSVNEEIQEMNRSLNNVKMPDMKDGGGGLFSGLGDKMSGALQVFAGNMLTKAAGAVANLGSEMYGMVQQGVEMARQGEGIRIAFERLGRGDILQGLREATHGTVTDLELMKAAVKFNDFKLPVEELGTMLAFAQQKAKDTGQSVDYMVDSIVTGLGRKSLMILDNLGLSAAEIKERMKETGDMTKAVGAIIRDQMAKAGDYVETAADRAAQANVSLQNKMEELGRKFAPLEEASNQLWTSMKIGILDIIGGPLAQLLNGMTEAGRLQNAINNMNGGGNGGPTRIDRMISMLGNGKSARSRNTYNQQLGVFDKRINQQKFRIASLSGNDAITRELKQKAETELQAIQAMRAEYISRADDIFNGKPTNSLNPTKDPKKGNKPPLTEFQKNQNTITELKQQFVDIMGAAAKSGKPLTEEQQKQTEEIQKQIQLLIKRNELLGLFGEMAMGKLSKRDFTLQGLSNTPGTLINPEETKKKTIDTTIPRGGLLLDDKDMKAVRKNIDDNLPKAEKKDSPMEGGKKMLNAISQLTGGLQQMGIELPSEIQGVIGVIQGAMQVIEAVNTIIGVTQTTALTANTAAMISLEAALWANTATSLIPFANGGVVRAAGGVVAGNTYSGDQIPALLNAGEVVLNRSQVGNLASQLQGGGMQNLNLTATIKGEQIRLVLNNNGRRTGRGEYVQSRNVR